MGVDYIRKKAGKPWRRKWDGGLDRLKMPTLFDLQIGEPSRVITAELSPGVRPKIGESYIVECEGNGLSVSHGIQQVGRIANPPPAMFEAVTKCNGIAEGVVQRISLFGDAVELELK